MRSRQVPADGVDQPCDPAEAEPGTRYRTGVFEFDPGVLELRRNGRPVRIRPQSLRLLKLLLVRPGEVVSREDIQQALWGSDTFVDFEQGVNHCINQLRVALRDAAESPRYIQTLPRRGYRFIAPVETIAPAHQPAAVAPPDPAQGNLELPAGRESTVVDRAPERFFRGWRRRAVAYVTLGMVAALGLLVTGTYVLRTRPGVPAQNQRTLVVLPFETTGTDPIVGLGLADVISVRLGGQRFVAVRSAAGRVNPQGGQSAAADARVALGADLVLGGQITRRGDDVSVFVQLTDVAAGTPTWSERFQVRAGELLNIEDVIAERVVAALKLHIAADEQKRLRRRYTNSAEAYEEYLRGRAALVEYTPEGTRQAIDAFGRALKHDPAYVLARAGLAMACADMCLRFAATADVQRWGERAESEAQAALDLDPELAEAHLARAAVARKREFDWSTTIAASRRALVLNPNLEQAHFFIAAADYHLGYMQEALIETDRGRRLHGTDVVEPIRIEALVALFSGNFTSARVHLEDVSRHSSSPIGDMYLGLAHYYSGNILRGRAILESLISHPSASTAMRARAALAGVLAAQGEHAAARALVRSVLTQDYRDHHVAYSLGAAYAQLGDAAEAFRWLRTAADTGFPCLPWLERDPMLDSIRRDARFSELATQVRVRREASLAALSNEM